MPQLPKDESLSAQGPLQDISALHHINVLMFGAAILQCSQNLNAGALQLSLFLHALPCLIKCGCSCISFHSS